MNSIEIREAFIRFFQSKGHEMIPSAPIVVKNDPTLMFINAGMNQFKDVFLGNSALDNPKVCNSQKCLRVSGKHNDLEEVGVDTYHHTLFEMLGNWSFGDYFKKEAIAWAWELLTDIFKIDKDRIYITVFEGDQEDGLELDTESLELWKKIVPEDRILKCDKKDNFWEMGSTGPCGPCSEIHVDLRSDAEREKVDGALLVNKDNPLVIEIWNLVFMEYNRMADRKLVPLPNKHVDTGMGFERLAMVLQGKQSNYDTDIFQGIIGEIEKQSDLKYGNGDETVDIAMRVISDHIRAVGFAIADGQLPSNNKAGYVIRRILRRAVRYGYQSLKFKKPFLYTLVPAVVDKMGGAFPEIKDQQQLVEKVIREEESSFFRTLEQGIKRIDAICSDAKNNGVDQISGKEVFELYDTYGFPDDLTLLIAKDHGLSIDEQGFENELKQQKDRSRKDAETETGDWVVLKELQDGEFKFLGYDDLNAEVQIVKYRKMVVKGKDRFQLVLNRTPFYPEGGGQVGDSGILSAGDSSIRILTTKKENNEVLHFAEVLIDELDQTFEARVDVDRRRLTTNNHSATHLVHHALRAVLGTHVEQKGSLVNDKSLRFDFSHFSKVSDEEIVQIESLVNQEIRSAIGLNEFRSVPMEKAQELGALALFGEKYGNEVRVIKFGESVELCGGCHVENTSQIGQFKILSESSVASGIRRIEAVTSIAADNYIKSELETLNAVREIMKNPKDLSKSIQDLIATNNSRQKQIEELQREKAKSVKSGLLNDVKDMNGVKFLAQRVDLDGGSIKDLAFQLKQEIDNLFMVLVGVQDQKATITVLLSDSLVKDKEMHAGNIVRDLAKEINGGGGGQPFFATAGGKNIDGVDRVLELAQGYLN